MSPGLADVLAALAGPEGWQARERFVVFTPDFQDAEFFLATWAAWRADPSRCTHLHFIAIAPRPPTRDALLQSAAAAGPVSQDAWASLIEAWPPLSHNLHRMAFDGGKVQLLLAPGTLREWLPELNLRVDAFCLPSPDTGSGPWPPEVFKAFARMSGPRASLFGMPSPDGADGWQATRTGLKSVGFQVRAGNASQGASLHAHYAPAFTPRRAPARSTAPASLEPHALIVGAGLAGSATACALAEQGWRSTVLDRRPAPALETSGNPGGLFHGIVNAQDGHHARFNRAAALEARRAVAAALQRPGAAGAIQGLLRLETSLPDAAAMTALLERLRLPADYVRALDPEEASERCGLPLSRPAWFYPGGGWVRPADLVASYFARASGFATFRGGVSVDRLKRQGTGWQLLDASGEVIAESEVVVLANAGDALRLLDQPAWPVNPVRGQVSLLPASTLPGPLPSIPLAGSGYLLPEVGGSALFGATSQPHDHDDRVRDSDHAHNLAQLSRLTGWDSSRLPHPSDGRTAWRCVSDDRLPIVGAMPDLEQAGDGRVCDQPRKLPRLPGLYVFTALGSRGITWSSLCAQVVASAIAGAPSPLESSLLDAIDPARFASRETRRSSARR